MIQHDTNSSLTSPVMMVGRGEWIDLHTSSSPSPYKEYVSIIICKKRVWYICFSHLILKYYNYHSRVILGVPNYIYITGEKKSTRNGRYEKAQGMGDMKYNRMHFYCFFCSVPSSNKSSSVLQLV